MLRIGGREAGWRILPGEPTTSLFSGSRRKSAFGDCRFGAPMPIGEAWPTARTYPACEEDPRDTRIKRKPPLYRALRDAAVRGHRAHTPVRPVRRLHLQGVVDEGSHALIVVGARSSGTKLVVQPFQPGLTITFAPLADGRRSHAQASRNGGVGQTLGTRQNDLRPLDQPARARAGPADLGELGQICVTEFKGSDRTTSWQWGHSFRGAHVIPLTCRTAHTSVLSWKYA